MKFSLSFLSPSIPPPLSVFTFRRQAKLKQPKSTSKEWTALSLSIDQICARWSFQKWTKKRWMKEEKSLANWQMLGKREITFIHPSCREEEAKYLVLSFHCSPFIESFTKKELKIVTKCYMSSFLLTSSSPYLNCLTTWLLPLSPSISQISISPFSNRPNILATRKLFKQKHKKDNSR